MGPPGSCRSQVGPMLAPWTLLSGLADNLELAAPALQLGAPRVSMKGLEAEPQWPYGVRSRGIGGANVAGTRTSTMENFPNSINISYISWTNDYFHKIVEGMHHEYMHLPKKNIFSPSYYLLNIETTGIDETSKSIKGFFVTYFVWKWESWNNFCIYPFWPLCPECVKNCIKLI